MLGVLAGCSNGTVRGVVKDSSTGRGIEGVAVSDGYQVVTTSASGRYSFKANPKARCVNITIPAAYQVPLDSLNSPDFYRHVDPLKGGRFDFTLSPLDSVETDWTFVAVSDPQCKYLWHVARFRNETVPDMQASIETSRFPHPYAVSLGDLTYDSPDTWEPMKKAVGNILLDDDSFLPMFNCIGNHDNDYRLLEEGDTVDLDYKASKTYFDFFGPTDYSFDRGNAHVIVMDNIIALSRGKNTCKYCAGFTDDQVEWLRQDIAAVKNPEEKLLLFCCHAPFRKGASKGGSNVNLDKNYDAVLSQMTAFYQAQIIIGHTHFPEYYVHKKYVTASGLPVFEQLHSAVCGCWWHTNMCVEGTPNGYALYEIKGNTVHNFLPKATLEPFESQVRVYDGNQSYPGKHATYKWEDKHKGGIIAAFFYGGKEYCEADFIWNGKVYPMERVTWDQRDWCAYSYFINESERRPDNDSYWKSPRHFWTVKVPGGDITKLKGWKVVARQTIPTSGVVNSYECSHVTKDFSEFMLADPNYVVLDKYNVEPDYSARRVQAQYK